MLQEIRKLRKQGHAIGITGSGTEWRCQFDAVTGKGKGPIEAFQDAKKQIAAERL